MASFEVTTEDLIDPETNQIPRLGVVGIPINAKTSPLLPEFRNSYGVYVLAMSDASHSNVAGLLAGDVIHEMNGALIADPAELRDRLTRMKSGDPIALLIERDKRLMYVAFEIE